MVEQVNFKKYGDIYYTNEINYVDGEGTLECGTISFTTDVNLIGKRIKEVSARHVRSDIILVRGKL